jgi:hypothetical protein
MGLACLFPSRHFLVTLFPRTSTLISEFVEIGNLIFPRTVIATVAAVLGFSRKKRQSKSERLAQREHGDSPGALFEILIAPNDQLIP